MEASPEEINTMDFESKGLTTDGKLVLSSHKAPVKSISIQVLHRNNCCGVAIRL